MSKRKSFVEATDSLLAAFTNGGGGAVNSNLFSLHASDKLMDVAYSMLCHILLNPVNHLYGSQWVIEIRCSD
jgi:hypothetical protein